MNWKEKYKDKLVTADEAVSQIRSGTRIFVDGNAALPDLLTGALARRTELKEIILNHLLTFGEDPFEKHDGVRHNAWFVGPGARKAVGEGRADYIPIFLSEIAKLIRSGRKHIDVALIHVSEPDRYGYMSLGIEVSVTKPAAEAARLVIAQVNSNMPRTLGDSFLHISDVDFLVDGPQDLVNCAAPAPNQAEEAIGRHIAGLIEDGSTLQMGIGAVPNAVLNNLGNKNDLGIHTEMFSDGLLPLLESGVVNNQAKTLHRGKVVSSFAMGTGDLYSYLDNNPVFEFHPSHYVNDPFVIAQNRSMVAINSALEVDLSGQVCADSIGRRIYSGIGGQVDFIRGAARSEGGKPIIALPATAKSGTISRIKPVLTEGAGVVTSRGDVHYVVTEFGVAELFGLNLRERADALIGIAHPDFRAELREEFGRSIADR